MVWRLFIAGLDTGVAAGHGLVVVGDVCLLGIGTVDLVGVQLCASEGLLARHVEALREGHVDALREVVGIAASISDIAPCLAGEVLRGLARLEMRGLAD